jgi:hypothetical protein
MNQFLMLMLTYFLVFLFELIFINNIKLILNLSQFLYFINLKLLYYILILFLLKFIKIIF